MYLTALSSRLTSLRRLLPLALLLLPALPTVASAQTAPTVITTVPYTISSSGTYVLGKDLLNTADAPAITINVANVVVDLNSYFVSGGGGDFQTVILINNVSGVTIKNGTVANGLIGIYSPTNSTGTAMRDALIDKVTVTHCTSAGVEFDSAVPGSVVSNCIFTSLGSFGLYLTGGVRVVDNTIDTSTAATSYGVYSTANDLVLGNTISNLTYGIYYTGTGGKYLNNLLYNCTNAFTGGTNASGNN